MKLLNVELKKIKNVAEVEKVDFLGLVDSHDVDPDLAGAENIEVLTIVDHHRAHIPPKARFVDMRNDVGATATIFVEYLAELFPLSVDQDDDRRIATALMHGLATRYGRLLARPLQRPPRRRAARRRLRSRSAAGPLAAPHRPERDGRHRPLARLAVRAP